MSYGYFYDYNKIRNSNNKRDIQTPLMSNLNYLVSQNKNKGIMNNKKNNNNKGGFFKDYDTREVGFSGINTNSKTEVIPKNKKYKNPNFPLDNKNPSNKYKPSINSYPDSNDNNYELTKPTSKKKLANSVFQISDDINDKYYPNNNNDNNDSGEFEKIISSKVGLGNLGNTCFMNTCLQNLIHSEDFIKRLLGKQQNIINNKRSKVISLKFLNLCKEMGASQTRHSINPSEFKQKFGSKHSLFSGYGQNDTQEFCRVLLEDMNRELNEVKHKAPYRELTTINKPKIECDKEFDELFRSRESSIVMESFYGQIINIFTCKCNAKEYSFQKVLDLPLLLKSSNTIVDIYDLLDYYFEGESIQFGTKCENCGAKTVHKKEIKFSRPPNILILSLQRIGRNQRKNNCMVRFTEELNISKYIDKECGHANEFRYSLYGIGNHSGTINFGHYYAYIKLNDKNWYEFNDSNVYKIGNIQLSSTNAYTLFYKKNI